MTIDHDSPAAARVFARDLRQAVDGRRRVHLGTVKNAFAARWPSLASSVDGRAALADLLAGAAAAGLLTPSVGTDHTARPPLPNHVDLPARTTTPRAAPTVAWPAELAWADRIPLNAPATRTLKLVSDWLRDTPGDVPLVSEQERALELFGDEKAFGKLGGETLWGPGRLSHGLLRCVPAPQPMAWTPVSGGGPDLLMVENAATFHSAAALLRVAASSRFGGVAYGAGNSAGKVVAYLPELPWTVRRLDYFGDLDLNGVRACAAACAAARSLGVEAGPHHALWRALVDHEPVVARMRHDRSVVLDAADDAGLGGPVGDRCADLAAQGLRIPQERLDRSTLAALPGWH